MKNKETNIGTNNSGDRNSGDYNSGYYNSGYYNSGLRNSGDRNSGNYNSGYYNSGNYNSGNYNSGHYNSGHYNSGNYNSGHYNSGNYNSGHYNSGHFNTTAPKVRLFNKDTDIEFKDFNMPYIDLKTNEWISEEDMSDTQKKADPNFHIKKGTLVTRTYKEAWQLAWSKATQEKKNEFLDLPNFDADIFFEITGVDVRQKSMTSCDGKVVEIDGKKYKLTEL